MRTSTAVREPLAPELPPAPRRRFASSRDSSRDSCRMARLYSGGSWCTPALCPGASRGAEPLGRVHEGHEVRSPGRCRRGRFGCLCWKLRGCAGAAGVGAAPQGPAHPGSPHHTLHRKATAAAQALVAGSYCLVDEAFLENIYIHQMLSEKSKVQVDSKTGCRLGTHPLLLEVGADTPSSCITDKLFRPRGVRPEQGCCAPPPACAWAQLVPGLPPVAAACGRQRVSCIARARPMLRLAQRQRLLQASMSTFL